MPGGAVEHAFFLELGEGIGAQHFGPLVAVVTGRVTAGEDVREAIGEAVVGRWTQHRDFLADAFEHLQHAAAVAVGGVQFEVEQAELDLPHHHQPGLEILRRQHLVQQVLWQRVAGLVVAGDQRQAVRLPAPVLHKLARQLHGIPRHAVDPGCAGVFDAGQQVVQAVAEFVEQGGDFIVGQQRRLAADGRGEVAHQIGYRAD